MIHEMHDMLVRARSRLRSVRLWSMLAVCWATWALVGWVAWTQAVHYRWESTWVAILAAAIVTACAGWGLLISGTRDPHWVARRVEARYPELGAALLAALEQAPIPRTRRLGYLQSSVIREAVHHGRRHNWARTVPLLQVRLAQAANLCALGVLILVCGMLVNRGDAIARLPADASAAPSVEPLDVDLDIQPGDTQLERGTTLLVVARFGSDVPADAALVFEQVESDVDGDDGEGSEQESSESTIRSRSMSRSLQDPQFVGRLAAVERDLLYHVEFDSGRSKQYRVTVFDFPALERADATLHYPEFTALSDKTIEDIRHVTAVEGTQLTLRFRLNKDVDEARLVDRDGNEIPLGRAVGDLPVYTATWSLESSRRFKLHLRDNQGRENKFPPEMVVNVTPNRPPDIKIAQPARDVKVSPLEELNVDAELSDDFGLLRYGISYSLGGEDLQEVALQDSSGSQAGRGPNNADLNHQIKFERLDVEPDQLVSYFLWAEDAIAEGGVRRTLSDMYFAEVRHFEEIFRQGEQPTEQQMREQQQAGQQTNGQQAEELTEMQKEIVNATWRLVRRETTPTLSEPFVDDARTIEQAQQQSISKLDELSGNINDSESRRHVSRARSEMESTLSQLAKAIDQPGVDPLRPALSSGQAAYQALLKLRAREFNVAQGMPQPGAPSGTASGSGGRSQQQLNQLELSADENRYETQSRALDQRDDQSTAANDQARQILDRLRKLARRQQDLNERVRELQAELQAVESEQEQEKIERELKRLREQQQEILRDTDQLRSEVENSPPQEQGQESLRRLEDTRSRVQQATEALEQGQLSQALTEGTRAGRQLDDLREEFRRRTGDRFNEEMREMRDAAQRLDERQQQLSERLRQQNNRENRTLRGGGNREELMQGLADQHQEYEELLERMQETVQQAEEPEPLLARQLYDTAQQAVEENLDEALEISQQLLEIGVTDEAAEPMRVADRGIERLREGVDRAAESVLGDGTEALRRAERQLRELSEELQDEIERAQEQESSQNESDATPSGPADDSPRLRSDTEAESTNPSGQGSPPSQQSPTAEQTTQQPASEQQATEQDGTGQDGAERAENRGGRRRPAGGGNARGGTQGPADWDQLLEGVLDPGGPITGEDFRPWNDRLRNVEELLDDLELRSEAARIRDRAEAARAEFKRNSQVPDWTKLTDLVAEPLVELQERIADEIRRQESPDALVPIDRDPVPDGIADSVRRYYERLGSGQ